ncbi:cytochrome P450 [Paenibacillus xylanexedens]|uniref:cytochrome P450 family protein n=1 Tax=Paenibacillus xylanexedens TaxID=528191 RepID=UPI001F19D6D8|nr:cytochrome P450 [Paenibacillus xylanexedens]MCF7754526.1 cytochrome P450 [Paenibacillus xylanexedens]
MNNSNNQTSEKVEFNLFSEENSKDPFAMFAQMRAKSSVVPIPNPMGGAGQTWIVTRMDVAMEVLKDQSRFTVDMNSIDRGNDIRKNLSDELGSSEPQTFFTGKSMLFVDEPDHRRLRSLVSKAFTPRYMESLRPRVQEIADELIDQFEGKGEMDLVKDYAYPFPINVISEMLGIPQEDRSQIHVWSEAIAKGLGFGKQDPAVAQHLRSFAEYTSQLVANKRIEPSDDLISQLIAIEEEGDRLNEDELISMITLLIFAGHETTSNLIATGSYLLLTHPEQLEQLKQDLNLVPSAVEELLRYNGPATSSGPRYATQDTELDGQLIQKGDVVIPLLKSANRDEQQFTDPEELDIERKIKRHLAFGHGIHMCLGAPLARVEGDVAFTTLLRRLPDLQLRVPQEEIQWHSALSSQGLASLPVKF